MRSDRTPRKRRPARFLVTLVALLAGLLAFGAATAAAVPGTQTWTGQSGGATPDLERSGLTLFGTDGSPLPIGSIAGTINFTLDGVARVGYCVDTSEVLSLGTEAVDVVTEDPPSSAAGRAAAWIIVNRTPTGAFTPAKATQGAVSQIAVWLLIDPAINATSPTSDAALNAAAQALVQEALAATAVPSTLSASVSGPAPGATTATVTILGKPGAVVQLAVTGGAGTLSASQVTIGAGGSASVTLTSASPGTTTVRATAAGDAKLILINPTRVNPSPQSTATAEGSTVATTFSVTFAAAQVPTVPTVPVTGTTAPRLSVTKAAPRRAKVLTSVRYTITVRNPGKVVARSVVLRDRIPSGMSFVKSSRRGSLSNGVVTYRLGNLAPGATRTVYVWLLAAADVRGSRTNVATVSATRVRPLSARAATIFTPLARRVQPAVTG